jgi:NAD(P)-dependent dehydrogenase (short-subunit alcohol dehydrogenase family)
MNDYSTKTVLITGANSGVGFEAAAQLAEAGWGTVILACRSEAKGEHARVKLRERTGRDPFEVLAIDTSEVGAAKRAVSELASRGAVVDFLVLNAGASGARPSFNADGVELTWASTLVGHHVLTMGMLASGLLAVDAHILIAGSEGARGMPGMTVHDIDKVAQERHGGDRAAAIESLARIKGPYAFNNMDEYVTAKLVVAWWAAALSRKVPAGMTVNAVSPGSAPSSSFGRGASAWMRLFMMPILKLLGPMMGMAGSIETAARRYVSAAEFTVKDSGHFFATADRKKLVGPLGIQTWPAYFVDSDKQEAGFDAVVKLTQTPYPVDAHAAA